MATRNDLLSGAVREGAAYLDSPTSTGSLTLDRRERSVVVHLLLELAAYREGAPHSDALAAADRDRRFADFVRKVSDYERDNELIPLRRFIDTINAEHWSIYGTPCTAQGTEGK